MDIISQLLTFKEFILNPISMSMIIPSSERLSLEMIKDIEKIRDKYVLELGPGTGKITEKIYNKIPKENVIVIEINSNMYNFLNKKFPNINLINGDAADLNIYLNKFGITNIGYVISSLPWAAFKEETQENILFNISTCLSKGGKFKTYSYIHTAYFRNTKNFKNLLSKYFSSVEESEIIWKNIPPAKIITCKK